VRARGEHRIAALLLAFALSSCATASSISPSDQAGGLAAVHRYVVTEKHWRARDYRVKSPERKRGLHVYEVVFLRDLNSAVPGGGESFWAYYDARRDKIVNVLYGQ
jgi:hypothetical protein